MTCARPASRSALPVRSKHLVAPAHPVTPVHPVTPAHPVTSRAPDAQEPLVTSDPRHAGETRPFMTRWAPFRALQHADPHPTPCPGPDRKSTRLNSSHVAISYAVFCLKKKKTELTT